MSPSPAHAPDDLVAVLCMVYHEARNVRHPIHSKRLDGAEVSKYARLVLLPTSKHKAWCALTSTRAAAQSQLDPETTYIEKFGLSVMDLAALFERPIWRDSATGGNQWANIAKRVRESLDLHLAGKFEERDQSIARLLQARHNTGTVQAKLRNLSSQC
jgi:hypothetical protein